MTVSSSLSESAARACHKVLPSPDAQEAIAVLDRMLAAWGGDPATQTRDDDFFQRDHARLWSQLCGDGWTSVAAAGAAEAADEGLDLVDLLALAEVWGRHLVPLPLLETLLVRRWSGAIAPGAIAPGVPADQLLTYAIADPRSGRALAPFGGRPGVTCVDQLPAPGGRVDVRPGAAAAGSPSYPLGVAAAGTRLGGDVRREVAALALAEAAGGAALCLDRTLAYAKTRVQFGRPIGAQQAVRHHLANLHMDVELARSSALAVTLAAPDEIWPRASRGFAHCSKAWETAIQVHGGIGYTWEGGLHFYAWQLHGLRAVARAAAGQPDGGAAAGPGGGPASENGTTGGAGQ